MKWNFSCIFFTLIVPYGYPLVTADTHYTSKFLSSNVDGYDQYDNSRSHLSHHSQHLSSEQSSDDYPSANTKRLFHVNNDLGSRSEPGNFENFSAISNSLCTFDPMLHMIFENQTFKESSSKYFILIESRS